MKTALILYPHQLYSVEHLPEVDTVFMVEEPLYFGVDSEYPLRLHKQKLILHRASMRRYVEDVLWPVHYEVEYVDLDPVASTGDILARVEKYDKVYIFDPVDDVLTKRLLLARRNGDNPSQSIEFLTNPNFYLKDDEVRQYFEQKHKNLFDDFYKWQRERFNIMIGEDYKPFGGKWTFDTETRKKLPKDHPLPSFAVYGDNQHVHDAVLWVNEHFPDNPGSTDFIWPTNHAEAAAWLEDFVTNRLDNFATYEDVIDGQAPWVYHSVLSASINIGLLNPVQVVEAALARHQKNPVELANLEGFVRQILGWREYTRGLYITRGGDMRNSNVFKQNRRLTEDWYNGTLGLPPFDDVVAKLQAHAYAHNIERLMVVGNLMLLCEIHPDDVYKWFSQYFIDAYDWVTVPNVYGMSQFADGGEVTTKPHVAASNYILNMSNYERGEWADIWDGLFWRFIDNHKSIIAHNPQMRAMTQRLERLDPDRRRIIGYRAEDFLNKYTKI